VKGVVIAAEKEEKVGMYVMVGGATDNEEAEVKSLALTIMGLPSYPTATKL